MRAFLSRLEALGNRLPDPLVLFAGMALLVVLGSALFAGHAVTHPGTGDPAVVQSLVTAPNVRRMFTDAVRNFSTFPPLGTVLVAVMGIGLAERTGLVAAALGGLVRSLPRRWLTAALVFAGVNSSIAADAGFVVLVPLGAALYAGAGRHPLAGLTVAYAAVSGGFGANVLVTALDPLLAGLTEAAARLVDPAAVVPATCNWWFNAVSVALLTMVGSAVAERFESGFGPWGGSVVVDEGPEASLWGAGAAAVAWIAVVAGLVSSGILRGEDGGYAPLYEAMVILVAIGAALPALAFGIGNGRIRSSTDLARLLAEACAGMGGYIVLAFAAAQFVSWFAWSNLGIVVAVNGADWVRPLGLGAEPLLLVMVIVSGVINLLIASASAKWAILAPVFVPMLMLLGVSPAQTQAAYRVGDAVTNVLTPLMPYVPIVLVTARRYVPGAGLGTVLAAQVPYAVAFGVTWTLLLLGWVSMGWSLGPGA
ncbi:MAG: AbgT family transporter [Pseudomonadota bacterium]|nr:AbgT family transporter [Pseudomonadota bacterium]